MWWWVGLIVTGLLMLLTVLCIWGALMIESRGAQRRTSYPSKSGEEKDRDASR